MLITDNKVIIFFSGLQRTECTVFFNTPEEDLETCYGCLSIVDPVECTRQIDCEFDLVKKLCKNT